MEKLQHYLKNFWENDKGQHMPVMLTNCSYVLKCNIMNVLYGFHIRNSYLFNVRLVLNSINMIFN